MLNASDPGHAEGHKRFTRAKFALLVAAALLAFPARPLLAQGSPTVTAVDPQSGSANDTITLTGENLDKAHVAAVFLSDDKDDHKAAIITQAADKITIKVPAVKAGGYNVSIQAGNAILIEPVRFTVQ
jgi:IPT/TIG domain-containing protein